MTVGKCTSTNSLNNLNDISVDTKPVRETQDDVLVYNELTIAVAQYVVVVRNSARCSIVPRTGCRRGDDVTLLSRGAAGVPVDAEAV